MKLNSDCQKSMMQYIEEKNVIKIDKYSQEAELIKISRQSILTAMLALGYTIEDAQYTFMYLHKNVYISTDGSPLEFVTDILEKGHSYLAQIRE